MSVTQVGVCADVAGRTSYLFVGVGNRRKEHLAAGTHRAAAMHIDGGSVQNFVRQGQQWSKEHGRKNQARSYVQSWALDELQPDNPEHVRMARDLGLELARRMHPNSPALVVTHTDGEGHDGCGGKLHNHIVVLNHDVTTNKALRSHQLHEDVVQTNDQLMRDYGLSVVERGLEVEGGHKLTRLDHYSRWRGEFQVGTEDKTFDDLLFDKLAEAISVEHVTTWEEYVAEVNARGVDVEEDQRGKGGITYKMLDETEGKEHRVRRRKASALSKDVTRKGVQAYLVEKCKQAPGKGTDHGVSETEAEHEPEYLQPVEDDQQQLALINSIRAAVSGIHEDDEQRREERDLEEQRKRAAKREQQRKRDEQRKRNEQRSAGRAEAAGQGHPGNSRGRSRPGTQSRSRKPRSNDYEPEF